MASSEGDPHPPGCPSSTPPDNRRRYSVATLLSLRHARVNHSIDHHACSRADGASGDVPVSPADELAVDASGRLRTSDVLNDVGSATFADMHLPPAVVAGLRAAGFDSPSPVQMRGIPVGRLGADVVAQAKSGTGKTGVFAALIAEAALTAPVGSPGALVLAPTRELARQTRAVVAGVVAPALAHASASAAGDDRGAENAVGTKEMRDVALLVGGGPVAGDLDALRHARAAVGTPGRVRALLEGGTLDAGGVRMLVLDEADRLLDPCAGFALGAVVGLLRGQRQTLAFSATYTPRLVARLRALMRAPQIVWLGDSVAENDKADGANGGAMARAAVLRGVRQFRVDVPVGYAKTDVFVQALGAHEFSGCLAFTGARDAAPGYAAAARRAGFAARHVSAKLTEKQRKEVVEEFATGAVNVLVCTDVMARGVSFDACDFVVQLDVAINTETHLHRVGRAGRFGTLGVAVVIVEAAQRGNLREVEADIGRLPAWPEANDFAMDVVASPPPAQKRRRLGEQANEVEDNRGQENSLIQADSRRLAALQEANDDDMEAASSSRPPQRTQKCRRKGDKASKDKISPEQTSQAAGDEKTATGGELLAQRGIKLGQLEGKSLRDSARTAQEALPVAGVSRAYAALRAADGDSRVGGSPADVLEGGSDETGGEAASLRAVPPPMTDCQPQCCPPSGQTLPPTGARCDEAWAEGFRHGYHRAFAVIRQISTHH